MNLKELYEKFGQSVWLDYIRRKLLTGGELRKMVEVDGLRGVTSNPTIFQKAIGGSDDYEETIHRLGAAGDATAGTIYEQLAVEDIQSAADILRSVYDASQRADGFVSMEVSPTLAHDTAGTLAEARRLWRKVERENLMVKVPATPEGIPAIQQLIGEGININVTLLFARAACSRVFEAYMAGLERFIEQGGDPRRVASVASLFVSRIDTAINPLLEAELPAGREAEREARRKLVGKVAIANSKLAYQDWKETCRGTRWRKLAQQGARPQRLLWASTGTKDPRMSDVAYVEALIGPDTVDTTPPATLEAFLAHGSPENRLEQGIPEASQVLAALAETGISLDQITDRLVAEGVQSFAKSFEDLMQTLEHKRTELRK